MPTEWLEFAQVAEVTVDNAQRLLRGKRSSAKNAK
jgi:hypothetical protein